MKANPQITVCSQGRAELREMVSRMAGGDELALAAFYDRTCSMVYASALAILKDESSAEEATLDVYLQAWRGARRYDRSRGTPSTWLKTMVRSRSIDLLRRRQRDRCSESLSDSLLRSLVADDNPERASVVSECRRRIEQALRQLCPEQRIVIVQAFLRGQTHGEMSRRLGLPLGTIKTRIRLGLKKLKETLQRADLLDALDSLS